jgi:hypothetical protein
VIHAWEEHMDYLKDHQPTLIHFSAFCWTISLLRHAEQWQVSKLTALGDVMWWDPALQLALMKYPPFMHIEEQHWQNFLKGYEYAVDEQRINLYALFTTICAAMGIYAEPAYVRNPYVRNELQEKVDRLLEKIHTETHRT